MTNTITKQIFILLANIFFIILISSNFSTSQTKNFKPEYWSLEPIKTYHISSDSKDFGGISGIIMESNGNQFTALTDKANYFIGFISRNIKGEIIEVEISDPYPILSSRGEPLKNRNLDSEALVRAVDGSFYIAFESNNRIMHHESLSSAGKFLPNHEGFDEFHYSKGIEALAISNDGLIYAIPEAPNANSNNIRAFVYDGKRWEKSFFINSVGNFYVTDATFAPDNTLLVLERNYSWAGFTSRIRRFIIRNNEAYFLQTLIQSRFREFDNLEGISIWLDKNGEYCLTLVSDDNFNIFQITQLVEFKIKIK